MSLRFLVIRQAYVLDTLKRDSIQHDIESLVSLINTVHPTAVVETCALTDDGEWLVHGRKINPASQLPTYTKTYICIHSADVTYDTAYLSARAHTATFSCLYNATDTLFHHAEKLAEVIALHGDVSAIRVKVPHQIHVDIEALNTDHISSDEIAGKHLRNLFLPIHVMETQAHDYLKKKDRSSSVEQKRLAHTFEEFVTHIDSARHSGKNLTFREHIKGPEVYFISIPDFRNKRIYTTLGFIHKEVSGRSYWAVQPLAHTVRQEVDAVVSHVSGLLFTNQLVVYSLSVHPRRGAFVQYTIPCLHFALQYPDFLTTVAKENGIPLSDLFLQL